MKRTRLNELTAAVRISKGSGAALAFHVEYVQPIQQYFEENDLDIESEEFIKAPAAWKGKKFVIYDQNGDKYSDGKFSD